MPAPRPRARRSASENVRNLLPAAGSGRDEVRDARVERGTPGCRRWTKRSAPRAACSAWTTAWLRSPPSTTPSTFHAAGAEPRSARSRPAARLKSRSANVILPSAGVASMSPMAWFSSDRSLAGHPAPDPGTACGSGPRRRPRRGRRPGRASASRPARRKRRSARPSSARSWEPSGGRDRDPTLRSATLSSQARAAPRRRMVARLHRPRPGLDVLNKGRTPGPARGRGTIGRVTDAARIDADLVRRLVAGQFPAVGRPPGDPGRQGRMGQRHLPARRCDVGAAPALRALGRAGRARADVAAAARAAAPAAGPRAAGAGRPRRGLPVSLVGRCAGSTASRRRPRRSPTRGGPRSTSPRSSPPCSGSTRTAARRRSGATASAAARSTTRATRRSWRRASPP